MLLQSLLTLSLMLCNDLEVEASERIIDSKVLHASKAFCVDVSTYTDVAFTAEERRRCDTSFVKKCEAKTQKICSDVTELRCDVVPFAECTLTLINTPYITSEIAQQLFERRVCRLGTKVISHTKMLPECHNVTKQNCITNWATDAQGNQVWAGNEACEPVEWRECRLVARAVPFEVPDVLCDGVNDVGYSDVVNVTKNQLLLTTQCNVNHTKSCKPFSSSKCMNLEYQECSDQPIVECEDDVVMVPSQEYVHRKKCLLPNVHESNGKEYSDDESFDSDQMATEEMDMDKHAVKDMEKTMEKTRLTSLGRRHVDESSKVLEEDFSIMAEYKPEMSLKADELKRWRLIRGKREGSGNDVVRVVFSQG